MLNMYSTPIRYTNFNGVKKTTTLYFHLTPRELADWMLDNMAHAERLQRTLGGIEEAAAADALGDATTEQKSAMLNLVRVLAELSNGVPTDDGEVFDKSGIRQFVHSAAYDAFRLFLFENPKELAQFVEVLLPEESLKEFASVLAESGKAPVLESENKASGSSKPRTKEELLRELAEYKD